MCTVHSIDRRSVLHITRNQKNEANEMKKESEKRMVSMRLVCIILLLSPWNTCEGFPRIKYSCWKSNVRCTENGMPSSMARWNQHRFARPLTKKQNSAFVNPKINEGNLKKRNRISFSYLLMLNFEALIECYDTIEYGQIS